MSCARLVPKAWACGHAYSKDHIPKLTIPFIRQCPNDVANEFMYYQVFGKFMGVCCKHMEESDLMLPWVCPSCHDDCFGPKGDLASLAEAIKLHCEATSSLIDSIIPAEEASLSQVRLLNEAFAMLQKSLQSVEDAQQVVLKLRDDAIREYLGFWWYQSAWRKDSVLPSTYQIARLKRFAERNVEPPTHVSSSDSPEMSDLIELSPLSEISDPVESSKTSQSDPDKLRAWLTVPVNLPEFKESPTDILEAFDLRNEHASWWTSYNGDSVGIHIARHLRQLVVHFDHFVKRDDSGEAAGEVANFRDVLVPDFALLLCEQGVLDKHLNGTHRKILQSISNTNLECLSEAARNARKEAVRTMLKTPLWIWRCRHTRYGAKTLRLVEPGSHDVRIVLQVVPESITDFIHGDELTFVK